MGWGAFHRAGPESDIDVFISHDRKDVAIGGIHALFADEIFISLVFRVHENRGIPEHRLWARRGDNEFLRGIHHIVREIEEFARVILVNDLDIA